MTLITCLGRARHQAPALSRHLSHINMASSISGSSFSQTLQFITKIKLQELEKQRKAYQAHARVIDEVASFDTIKKVEVLAKAVKAWSGSGALPDPKTATIGGRLQLENLEFWLQQAKNDPSFSDEVAKEWAATLEEHIGHMGTRFDAARLFGNLFNEWLSSGDSVALEYQTGPEAAAVDTPSDGKEFVDVGRAEMYEQKAALESIIFKEPAVDTAALKDYLAALFSSEDAAKALKDLRKEMKKESLNLQRRKVNADEVKTIIRGLLITGLMDEEKRTTLKAFEENANIMKEIASVLNMRVAGLDTWVWPTEGISFEFRRHMNGKYRAFADPDIIDALLLHYIGMQWQVLIKKALRKVFESKAWKRAEPPSHKVNMFRKLQLRGDDGSQSIEAQRRNMQRNDFFLTQMADTVNTAKVYDDNVDGSDNDGSNNGPVDIKQKLLHMMTTECYLNTELHGTHAAVCSDFEWFGPSLPHSSILTILEFLGMSKPWLSFYKAFLAAPVRFAGDTDARIRTCGTPFNYSLSLVCGEAIMFFMDFTVNQRAEGLFLYRMHDDLWLWDAKVDKVAAGWTEMQKYAALVGLRFNEKKTGSAYIGPTTNTVARLPAGEILWGFLKFDAAASRFRLNQEDVDLHIVEMRRQLASTKSLFGWVNAYNKYMAFFLRNFGGVPANCFGHEHIVDTVDTLARIQRELFPEGGGAVGSLKKALADRFGITDLPEGYFYFPISSGGLELRNVMLELLALERRGKPLIVQANALNVSTTSATDKEKAEDDTDTDHSESRKSAFSDDSDSDDDDPENYAQPRWVDGIKVDPQLDEPFEEAIAIANKKFSARVEHDCKAYMRLKEVWTQDEDNRRTEHAHFSAENDEFMSLEEFTALRESWLRGWGDSYRHMLERPNLARRELPSAVDDSLSTFEARNWYQSWLLSMYGDGVLKKFGSLDIVDPELIPVGMVQLFKSSRIKLDQ
ncbi:hypothetical protein D9619_009071 [Psilocybe cf. subviscida]|uniref:Reverse transcriptase domain-containing protein n=1 Tax=Psilocybe cf. subviscida TaxID=2480587 RepID=A0A8H5FAI9_9AGAR|nr:hypothetical protein D9619_009071 [Psilocybe cf. subviscida]